MVTSRAALPILCAAAMFAQTSLTELRVRVEPDNRKIRPLETAVVQVIVQGTIADARTGTRAGRLQRDGFAARIEPANGGFLSKAFRFQGVESEEFLQTRSSAFAQLIGKNVGQYTVKDAFLYTAPETPGKYKLTFELEGKSVSTEIEVATDAPSTRPEEKQSFPDEQPSQDPYRKLAEHYAPFVAQETWFQPKSDFLARFDYDGDWRGDNNWDHLDQGSSQAYVYYAAIETGTHIFLHYSFFHPRDYSDNCVIGTCHENDNEGIIVAVQKDGSEFGRLQVLQTLAHNNVYSYVNDGSLRGKLHDIEGTVPFWKDTHPMVFLEAGGHGAYAADDRRSLYATDAQRFANTGVTYVYKGKAERPKFACDREVGYALLPVYEHWWTKASSADWKEPTFDDFYMYQPFGGRPAMKNTRISGAFLGRKQAENKARPFWGWFDTRARKAGVIAQGQWALDPAYSVSQYLAFPAQQKFALDYTYNPFLDIEPQGARAEMRAPEGFVAATAVQAGSLPRAATSATASQQPLKSLAGTALGQVLSGGDKSAIGAAMQRLGVGSGGTDALRSVAGSLGGAIAAAGECVLSATLSAAGDLTVRGTQALNAAGAAQHLQCSAALPSSAVQVKLERKSGPEAAQIIEQPSAANSFTVKIRFDQPGDYHVVLRW